MRSARPGTTPEHVACRKLAYGPHVLVASARFRPLHDQRFARPDRELPVERRVELAHEHDIHVAVQRLGYNLPHRHRAARDREHERMLASILFQAMREEPSGLGPILKCHPGSPAFRRAMNVSGRGRQ